MDKKEDGCKTVHCGNRTLPTFRTQFCEQLFLKKPRQDLKNYILHIIGHSKMIMLNHAFSLAKYGYFTGL